MKQAFILALLAFFLIGCAQQSVITGTAELLLNEQDLQKLNMAFDTQGLQELGYEGCHTESAYGNIVDASQGAYSICAYTYQETPIIIEIKQFENKEALDGSYQYESSHLFSVEGIINENTFGDQSKFHVNTASDYGGNLDPEGLYVYHLWFTKDLYLVHVTSRGMEDVQVQIAAIGEQIMQKFS